MAKEIDKLEVPRIDGLPLNQQVAALAEYCVRLHKVLRHELGAKKQTIENGGSE